MSDVIRTRALGDLVGDTFRIYVKDFFKLSGIVALANAIPAVLIFLWILTTIFSVFLHQMKPPLIPAGFEEEMPFPSGWWHWFIIILVVETLFAIFVYPLMNGSLIYAAVQANNNQPFRILEAYRSAGRRYGRLVGANILYGLVITLLSITIIGIPFALYFFVRWLFLPYLIIVEDTGIGDAFQRSTELVRGNWWRTFGILSLLWFLYFGVTYAFELIPMIGLFAVLLGIALPILTIGNLLLYYDLRARKAKEG
ncbi:hypothetical protein DRP53_02710 [candidate division WOR-3 bacterium]|uniref:DUF7847 domain-containing protein n=1 Tax=candidate division WOR-3 bacterium TaxID=2052148 RepID=A0A660SK17_UNCW3|nr:MAG: hypothetical protein DRP53_02710 [candidate division WOR-3 bacterium]